jgi:hypothetical protein
VAPQPFGGVRSQYRKIQENKVPDIKSSEKASQVFAADLAALRDDITKLTASISELMPEHGYDKHGLPLPVGARRIFRRFADWGDEPYKEMNSLMK